MILSDPITITPPSFTRKTGEVRTFQPITFSELDITIIDNPKKKKVVISISGIPKHLTLWEKTAYDSAGDYTQAQVEARILELLGNDPVKVLTNLFRV